MSASPSDCLKAGDITLRSKMDVRGHFVASSEVVLVLVVEWTIVELAETLMLAGVIRRYVVGEPEEEVTEGFPRDEVETRFLDTTGMWPGGDLAAGNPRDSLHLFESVYDRGVEFVFEG
jgi:hypothetical protein